MFRRVTIFLNLQLFFDLHLKQTKKNQLTRAKSKSKGVALA